MNYKEILKDGSQILKSKKIFSYHLDSELLLSLAVKMDRSDVLLNLNKNIKNNEKKLFYSFIDRRKNNEPIAYIFGFKEFWKKKFKVDKNVLIPRPDTEILIEEALKELHLNAKKNILDIGTGSGCILISILNERKKCKGTGIDVSKKAIHIAKYNAKIQHFKNRINFINSDIDNFYTDQYDLIVSNPPYIKLIDIKGLEKDIRNHEPKIALDGGMDGYSKIRLVIKKSSNLIKRKGKLVIEIGASQAIETIKELSLNGFYCNRIIKDLAKKNRCLVSTKI